MSSRRLHISLEIAGSTRKRPENKGYNCTDIPLASDASRKDTNLMHLAESTLPKLDCLRHSMDAIAASARDCGGNVFKRFIYHPIIMRTKVRRALLSNTQALENTAQRSEDAWTSLLREFRRKGEPFSFQLEDLKDVRCRVAEIESDLDSVLSDLHVISQQFPGIAVRIQVAAEKIKQIQCRYIALIVSEDDPQMIASAERHYADGKLMDIETFANGLLRNQPMPSRQG